uniref:Uncharacterized protein n=1 Tax=Zea mays TaxID=4577 RepID=B7ZYJ8_MAIZE|nr:unknown [Zea mays]ACN36916.1 unknown [Zea mays]
MCEEIIFSFMFKRICPCDIFHSNVKCWKNNLQTSTEKSYTTNVLCITTGLQLANKFPQIYQSMGISEINLSMIKTCNYTRSML